MENQPQDTGVPSSYAGASTGQEALIGRSKPSQEDFWLQKVVANPLEGKPTP